VAFIFAPMVKSRIDLFKEFVLSEKGGGFVLIGATLVSLIIANSPWGEGYIHFWHTELGSHSIEHWINDGLMAIFFLLVGLEIERELYVGELSSIRNAILPIVAAVGGMMLPALVHFAFNAGEETVSGFGIPMATDIAFALGVLSLAGRRVPITLKVFLTALAIIDDLGAITVIALFYSTGFSATYFFLAIGIFLFLFIAGKRKIYTLWLYIPAGIVMWYCMLQSGVHASIAGVLLAFAIPFHKVDEKNPSYHLQHQLHFPVAYGILPIFALANTAIVFPENLQEAFVTKNSLGIMFGLVLGKFAGIFLFTWLAVRMKLGKLPGDLRWSHIASVGLLGGIGFTMSIFITNLAFSDAEVITASKMSILAASLIAALAGLFVAKRASR
jgi:NhaA family Na+:H+ antiporter